MFILFVFLQLFAISFCQFQISLPITSSSDSDRLQSKLPFSKKQVFINIELTSPDLIICCKPNDHIFQIIHNFLSNPFYQINEYTCPSSKTLTDQVRLPVLGILKMDFQIMKAPECREGVLGLSKNSKFISYLPVNSHTIQIDIDSSSNDGLSGNKMKVSFGESDVRNVGEVWTFDSSDKQLWNLKLKSVQLGLITIDYEPNMVLSSTGLDIKIPPNMYDKIILYYPNNQTCQLNGEKLLCLCESGIPAYFPKFYINLQNSQKLQISPQQYMSIDSNICTLRFSKSADNNWYFNVVYFSNTKFQFDSTNSQISIQRKQISKNQSSALISLPIPLILNCAVVLLLCIFASLVVIQITKRISGLSEVNTESLRQYMMRRTLV